ncbi:xaa-Pro aminopeptidase 1 [Aplysia californica]|uniref:Xaa-Pro aminopeptidase 1 n=1 Tax=Aplysia californica TaxID=6500 RepID=A0ABM0JA53_APLCA|nr:xaa-Pro aminopeptidase 1 [Aplysia californica]XP_012939620.1 xaa-Pro aminopeptidase 1 [Aplysia californica]XP_012939695.1 xaa-Pro aminopeptidase 1 [Aplysia californica]
MSKGSGAILSRLRSFMRNPAHVSQPLDAYIVPTGDAHQSEYVAECDSRRSFLSGFTGSAGVAIVTTKLAALWTDGRYYLQAGQQLSGDWELMKDGLPDTPSYSEWLNKVLPVGGRVGCDPSLLAYDRWMKLYKELKCDGHELVDVDENLVDLVWTERPDPPCSQLIILTLDEAGLSWQQKVSNIQESLVELSVSAVVITALDEVAWLFNMRGADIEFNPVFISYAIVTRDSANLFIDDEKLTSKVRQHLSGVKIHPYSSVYSFLSTLAQTDSSKIWVNETSSFAIFRQVPKVKRHVEPSPVAVKKAVKNANEMKGMERAQVKDAVALCEFFHWLEKEVPKGNVTEMSAAEKAENLRSQQENYVSLSFDTISSIGPHGAIIHYKPTPDTDTPVTTEEVFLVDSGAQYRDGTTDTTRTVHLGTPSKHEQECFTRVLKGHINLSSAIFPNGIKGQMLDTLARTSLWSVGLDYRHGTGHGVGAFLNVHEGPCGISFRVRNNEIPLEENMVLTDEPGYYEDGNFGVRIENCIKVVKADTKHNFGQVGFLTFEPITVVPIQKKMIDASLLTEFEVSWLNQYHAKVRSLVGDELKRQGKKEVYQWLLQATEPLG